MRIVFAGSPDIAVPSLEKIASNFNIVGVLTNPDKVTGRGQKIKLNPIKSKAMELNLNILQPHSLDSEVRKNIISLRPDILVVFAYGKIFGPRFLSMFAMGGINVHPSLLPKYRGSSPILSAIINGDNETGISIQRINLEMDTGALLNQQFIKLSGNETTESLSTFISTEGAELLIQTLREIESGHVNEKTQDTDFVSYCTKIIKDDGIINWKESAVVIDRKIRAYTPWPKAYTQFKHKNLMLLECGLFHGETDKSGSPGEVLGFDKNNGILIQTGDGVLVVKLLQLQSKKANNWKSFINGTHEFIGCVLGGE
ncbi:MAG: methionyl-tRNA formyltransferase [Spirochaetia bacterium]|jgi:methionyl-tRNA formyltransferase|nr:methionyl-tRNA formyltransferase [Spirochaetia bacterium]